MLKNYSIIWPATNERYTPENFSIGGYMMLCKRYPDVFANTFVVPADAKCRGV